MPFLIFGLQTSQDIRKRVKAGHVMTYAEHAHLERGANVSSPRFLAGRCVVRRVFSIVCVPPPENSSCWKLFPDVVPLAFVERPLGARIHLLCVGVVQQSFTCCSWQCTIWFLPPALIPSTCSYFHAVRSPRDCHGNRTAENCCNTLSPTRYHRRTSCTWSGTSRGSFPRLS